MAKVGRLGQAAKLSAECPGLFLPVFPAAGTGTQEGRSYPAPWVEGCWGPRGLSLQPLREFTQGMGEKNQGWQRPQEHPLHGLPWPLLQTSAACQQPMNVRGPKLGPWGGSGSDQTERLCQGSGARGGQSILVVLEARPGSTQLRRGEAQGGFPLQRFPTRAWGAFCCLSLFWLAGTLPDPALPPAVAGPASPAWCWPPPAFTSTPGRRAGWVTAYCTNLFEEKPGSKKPAPAQSPPAVSHSLPQCSWHRS